MVMEEQTTSRPRPMPSTSSENVTVKSPVIYMWEIIENLCCEFENCTQKFNNMLEFTQHVTVHGNLTVIVGQDFIFNCTWKGCNATIFDVFTMLRHLLFHAHHNRLKLQGSNYLKTKKLPEESCKMTPTPIPDVSKNFACQWDKCKALFDSVEMYYRHTEKHARDNPKGNNLKDQVSCLWKDCKMKFNSLYKLRDHLRSHTKEKVIACPECGVMFSSTSKFFDHIKRQEEISEDTAIIFECGYCTKNFLTERLLNQHMQRHINHHKCPSCDMTSTSVAALNLHISYRHSELRNFACSTCPYKAKCKRSLSRHELSHKANEKPYKCAKCSFTARAQRLIKHHVNEKHNKESELARYYCHLCDKNYAEGHSLSVHLSRNHKLKWPPGFRRFRFVKGNDNKFKLQLTRLEFVELKNPSLMKVQESAKDGRLTKKPKIIKTTLDSDSYLVISSSDAQKGVSILKQNEDGSVELEVSGEIIAEG